MKLLKTTDKQTGEEIQLSYCDYGKGRPVVLLHGWPLSKEMWEYQLDPLVNAGLRVVKYDRRGFGKSSKPWDSYDYDSLTDDLHAVLTELDLRDVTLVGFSMGGGEAVRYLGRYGSDRVSRLVLISAVTPYLGRSADNPDGVPESVFAEMLEGIRSDRIAFLDEFGKKFFGAGLLSHPVSTPLLDYYRMLASHASQRSTVQCALSFAHTDFRADLKAITVPTLIIHGDADKTVPIDASSARTARMIDNSEYIVYEGAPHGLFYTHKDRLNDDLLRFVAQGEPALTAASGQTK
ncbi:alpha/beta fold hydrolase [Flaviaesturariibacter aridisoli]|uniref:Alpha/beta hydrolase n=1 Tax=Flaviaesturariibacter aridisoli TaxID=2545761 RepID=A0A4R4E121_9BACT|nr:alpha/beta hydrolase [Flaviaesturariibacter aridisoli]TCZ68251.1 alpha/beta hydrolase [Flaviaesturariibacter aridisoli]